MVTQERVKELFDYDPETGAFVWKVAHGSSKRIPAGTVVKTVTVRGYIAVRFDGKLHLVHRLIWLYVYGYMPVEVDHRNNIPTDNRLVNLRPCDRLRNAKNVKCHKDTASGIKGVYKTKNGKRWTSRIMVNGQDHVLGTFDTPEAASAAYKEAAFKYHGEFANVG